MKKALIILSVLLVTSIAFGRAICVGDRVVTNDHYTGTVTFVYPDGTAAVRYDQDGYNHTRPLRVLSIIQSRIGRFAVGDQVVTNDHYTGRITFLYPDGTAAIRYDQDGYNHTRPVSVIHHIQNQIGKFRVGDRVVTSDHYTGRITFLYPDGTAAVRYDQDGYNHTRPVSVLWLVQSCASNCN